MESKTLTRIKLYSQAQVSKKAPRMFPSHSYLYPNNRVLKTFRIEITQENLKEAPTLPPASAMETRSNCQASTTKIRT